MMHRRFVPLLGFLLLAGCAGKPIEYLTLAPQQSQMTYMPLSNKPVSVADVAIPPSLDRRDVVSAIGSNKIDVASHAEWAAPLDGLIQRALAQDFAERLSGTQVLMPGDPAPSHGEQLVQVNVQNFIANQAGTVTLDADWAVQSTQNHHVVASGRNHIVVQGSPTPEGQAAAMSTALAHLADIIAGKLSQ